MKWFRKEIIGIVIIFLLMHCKGVSHAQSAMFQNQITVYNPALTGKFNTIRVSTLYSQFYNRTAQLPNYNVLLNSEYLVDQLNSGFGLNYQYARSFYSAHHLVDLTYAYHHKIDEEWSFGVGLSSSYAQSEVVDELANELPGFPEFGTIYNNYLSLNPGVYTAYNDFAFGVGIRNALTHRLDTFPSANNRVVPSIQLRYDFSVGQRWLFSTTNQVVFETNSSLIEMNLMGTRNGNFWLLSGYKNQSWGYRNIFSGGIGFTPWKRFEVGYIQNIHQFNVNSSGWSLGTMEITLSYRIPSVNRSTVTCGFCIERE